MRTWGEEEEEGFRAIEGTIGHHQRADRGEHGGLHASLNKRGRIIDRHYADLLMLLPHGVESKKDMGAARTDPVCANRGGG